MPESTSLPDPQLEKVMPLLRDKWAASCALIQAGSRRWQSIFDSSTAELFAAHLQEIGAHEGTIWLLDRANEALVPAHNNGPQAANFVGKFHQPLGHGIVSTVFATQSGVCESWAYRNAQHDPTANKEMHVVTVHMIAVPFYFGGETHGVISAVKVRPAGSAPADDPPPFDHNGLPVMRRLAFLLGELFDSRVLRSLMGMR